jgi:hypothetical protein
MVFTLIRDDPIKITAGILMIKNSFKEVFSPEWLETNITNPIHELVIIREIITWEKIVSRLCRFVWVDEK